MNIPINIQQQKLQNLQNDIYDLLHGVKCMFVISSQEFLEFMYKIESLILLLFEKYEEFEPNILQYINNSLLDNLPLLQSFNILLDITNQQLLITTAERQELKDDTWIFLYERIIFI